MQVSPFRSFNEKRRFFGLNAMDGVGIGLIFLLFDLLLQTTPYEVLAVLIIPLLAFILIPIRMFKRRKILRDTLVYFVSPRRLYDPKLVSKTQSL